MQIWSRHARMFGRTKPSKSTVIVELLEGRVVGPCWEKLKPNGPKGFEEGAARM